MEINEPALIEAARKGDSEAFGVIVERYMPKALAFARQMTGNADDAQDVAQEAFIKAYRGLGSFKGESGFYTWFFRILSNLCIDHQRRTSFLKKVFFFAGPDTGDEEESLDPAELAADLSPESRPDESLERAEAGAALRKAVMGLPARQRAVLLLKHNEGMRITEIASVLGISEGAVKSHLVRAVTALRKGMREYENRA